MAFQVCQWIEYSGIRRSYFSEEMKRIEEVSEEVCGGVFEKRDEALASFNKNMNKALNTCPLGIIASYECFHARMVGNMPTTKTVNWPSWDYLKTYDLGIGEYLLLALSLPLAFCLEGALPTAPNLCTPVTPPD